MNLNLIIGGSFFSPLEQFEIFPIFFIYSFPVLNFIIYLVLLCFFIFLFFWMVGFFFNIVPRSFYFLSIEYLYLFLVNLIRQQCGLNGLKCFPLFFCFFIFIIFSNLLGLFPFSFTITSQIFVTAFMAVSWNLGLFIYGLVRYGDRFFCLFVPSGVPVILLPLIVVIEFVSYLLRSFSLSIRLAANMMAGHTLLYILSMFSLLGFLSGSGFNSFVFAAIPFLFILVALVLEFGIALLQAYVFVVLMILYLNDIENIGNH